MANPTFPGSREPLAIVGIGCRFPGGITGAASYWKFLCRGGDGITEVPPDRWNIAALYDEDRQRPGKVYTRKGGFLDGIGLFDPHFFGISPREASFMDPQQRLLLEVTWEALEDGGIPPESIAGGGTGVFVGVFMHDYENMLTAPSERDLQGPHSATGASTTITANRISYVYDLRGPSLVVDTACSSSLAAVHLACQSIWTGESPMALAGGVNLQVRPEMTMALCRGGFLSADGYSKAFDARADGYTRADGVGIVVIKPLAQALADGNPVYALIRGSAVNQDGRSDGLTVPRAASQKAVIRDALRVAGISPRDVAYVEAHGTGTPVGDPIEAQALGEVLGEDRSITDFCVIGSVKTNFGHTESAAGVAGLIKAALALRHGQVPANLHFRSPHPAIPFERLKLRVPTRLEPWPRNSGSRIAGVNSFGFGGTNAHVVLEAFDRAPAPEPQANQSQCFLLPLSARSPEALRAVAAGCRDLIRSHTELLQPADLVHTYAFGKGRHPFRLTVVGRSLEEAAEGLDAYLNGDQHQAVVQGEFPGDAPRKLAFVFSGMGQQWWGMGRRLLERNAEFRAAIEECDALFRRHTRDWSLIDELKSDEVRSRIHDTRIAQAAILAVQLGLVASLRALGIVPEVVVGHSVGELAAFTTAGALTVEEAVQISYHRGRLQHSQAGYGGMLAVGLPFEEAQALLSGHPGELALAAVNSPSSVTLSGPLPALRVIADSLEKRQVFARFLPVDVPYHSPAMEPILAEFRATLESIKGAPPVMALYSTATGEAVRGRMDPQVYWPRNVREPVQFLNAFRAMIDVGCDAFIEVAAHPVLASSMRECLDTANRRGVVAASLRRNVDDEMSLFAALGRLHGAGFPLDWKVLGAAGGRLIGVPAYPWQRNYYWRESEASVLSRQGRQVPSIVSRASGDCLLGRRLDAPSPVWSVDVGLTGLPLLAGHRVQGSIVYPAAAFLNAALAACREIHPERSAGVNEVDFETPLLLPPSGEVRIQLAVNGGGRFRIDSRGADTASAWGRHVTGVIAPGGDARPAREDLDGLRLGIHSVVPRDEFYEQLRVRGLDYGPSFRGVAEVTVGPDEAFGTIEIPAGAGESGEFLIHPALLDAAFQLLGGLRQSGVYLPAHVDQLRLIESPGSRCLCHAKIVEEGARHVRGDIRLFDEQGRILVEMRGFECRRFEESRMAHPDAVLAHSYDQEWILCPPACHSPLPGPAVLAGRLRDQVAELASRDPVRGYDGEVRRCLDGCCTAYIVSALREMGWRCDGISTFDAASLASELAVAEPHRRLFDRLLEMLADAGVLSREQGCYRSPRALERTDPEVLYREAVAGFPAFHAELMLIQRCGSRLASILRGKEDALSLIFSEGSMLASHLYQDSPTFGFYNRLARLALTEMVAHVPEHEPLRVLEIGGGTGSLTTYLLSVLPPARTRYVFTDISAHFVNQARERFREFRFVECRQLDIENPPLTQGFGPNQFDLIVASSTLHATSSLASTLGHAKALLTSGGSLMLIEPSPALGWLDLVFGLLPGWWLFQDAQVRGGRTLLTPGAWQAVLKDNGFEDARVLASHSESVSGVQSVIFARGPAVAAPAAQAEPALSARAAAPWILFDDERGFGERLGRELNVAGICSVRIRRGAEFDPESPPQYRSVFEYVRQNSSAAPVVVFCWAADISPSDEDAANALPDACQALCAWTLDALNALVEGPWTGRPEFWLLTFGAAEIENPDRIALAQSPLRGLCRTALNEHSGLSVKMVDLSACPGEAELAALRCELLAPDAEDEIALRFNSRYVHRAKRLRPPPGSRRQDSPFVAVRGARPSIEGLEFHETNPRAPGAGEVALQVRAAGLNFKDVARVTGLLEEADGSSRALGLECSGIVTALGSGVEQFQAGDEVMGLAMGCLGSHALTDPRALVLKPSWMSHEMAAGIPVVFVTAVYALRRLANLQAGERVLIHSAAGGVGLAAIQVARAAGAEVLATAGTREKRDYLHALGIEYVGDSRSLDFAGDVMSFTRGQGVDVVLNTLTGDGITESLSLLRPITGRFIDIANVREKVFALSGLHRGLSFHAFDLGVMFGSRPEMAREMLHEILGDMSSGRLHPLPFRAFPTPGLMDAVRAMRQGRHIGKFTISMNGDSVAAEPMSERIPLSASATYLITGGLGGFGLAVAEWLAACGARHLVLASRHQPDGAATQLLARMRACGVRVEVCKVDVSCPDQVSAMFDRLAAGPPLGGVIHAAMVLQDRPLSQTSTEDLRDVFDPKIRGAWNLHLATLGLELEFFILFSSVAAFLGHSGQANYCAANEFLDSLARERRRRGLPALSIGWGAIGEVGYVSKHPEIREHFRRQGVEPLSLSQAWRAIAYGLRERLPYLAVMPADWRGLARYSAAVAASPRFSHLRPPADQMQAVAASGEPYLALKGSPQQRRDTLAGILLTEVAAVLGMPGDELDPAQPIESLGFDSLMAVELLVRVEQQTHAVLPRMSVLQPGLSVDQIVVMVEKELDGPRSGPAIPDPTAPAAGQDVADLSDEEVNALLGELLGGTARDHA